MNKIFLYISSYVPLYLILILKNAILKLENIKWNFKEIKYFNTLDDYILTILAFLTVFSLVYIHGLLSDLKKYQKNTYRVVKINNSSNDSILNYISIYILTFIDFNLNSISNIMTLAFIMSLLGMISIKYDGLYINPTLLFWNYRIYNITINKRGKESEKIILVKGNLNNNTKLEIYESNRQYAFASILEQE